MAVHQMLQRVLEPEVMDSEVEAVEYNSMDHAEVNRRFVEDLIAAQTDLTSVLDLGTGTALIPIELCRTAPHVHILAVDAARHMLAVSQRNIAGAGLSAQIELQLVDAKRLPYADGQFLTVMSNSILHHIPDPMPMLAEAVRVCSNGGSLFIRDLMRPASKQAIEEFVDRHAAGANDHQRKMFGESLHAALTLEEIRALVCSLGFDAATVQATSDRHWTWSCRQTR